MKKIFIAISSIILVGCTFFNPYLERDNERYWLNNLKSYKTYPIHFYDNENELSDKKLVSSKTVNLHEYKHNVVVSANLGQRMVDSQTYTINNYSKGKIVAHTDGEIYSINNTIKIKRGDVFTPLGEIKYNGKYYMLIDADGHGSILLVDEQGYFLDKIAILYNGDLILPRDEFNMLPKNLGVDLVNNIDKDVSKPKLQFEIKYDGLEYGLMNFVYVDYSNADSSEGYFQRFSFPQQQNLLNINGIKFKIMDAYPDRIEYMLLD